MDSSFLKAILTLAVIAGGLYLFSPQSGLIKTTVVETAEASKILQLDIKNRTLADPNQGDIQIKVGERAVFQVTTDEDGKLDLSSLDRDVFNPVFSGAANTLTIPTDKAGTWRIIFYPGADSNRPTDGITIGTVVVEN